MINVFLAILIGFGGVDKDRVKRVEIKDRVKICRDMYNENCTPSLEDLPCRITNYWVWDENGVMFDGYMGQCDADCSVTANGTVLSKDLDWQIAAAPLRYMNDTVELNDGADRLRIVDTFGLEAWQEGPIFYHQWYESGIWAIPIDVFTEQPLSYMDWSCSIN